MEHQKQRQLFEDPDSSYRSLPFWAWNFKLEETEIRRQIKEMKDKGIGGFFMHSREGLETEYMGPQWKNMVVAAVDEAKKQKMEAWLYDEDRWPSGTAGGSLGQRYGDEVRCKGLTLEICPEDDSSWENEKTIEARFEGEISGMSISQLRRLSGTQPPSKGLSHLILRVEISGKSDWFNADAPPDNLNPKAVDHFISSTHEKYKDLVGEEFGKTVPGIFTDEPSLHDNHAFFGEKRAWIPWTTGFTDYFTEKRGYHPLDTIPLLYFNTDQSRKIRHDYWWTITERFAESYSKRIGAWCTKNGIAYTGHFLQEDKLGLSTRVNGSIMPHYVHQDVPGIDMLREQTDEYLTVKQCSSVAHQYEKPQVLSETYGCTGWDFSFAGQKWVGDWQFALGVNRLSKHLSFYSIKGCRKRDYPPSFHYNTTWWEENNTMEDYFSRLSAVLQGGTPLRDILVLHPSTTAWSRLGCSPYGNPIRREERDVAAINDYGYDLNTLLGQLSAVHHDYDLADELLLAQDGNVEKSRLALGKAKYAMVILPPIDTMLESTANLLEEYLESGGQILALSPVATCIEGEEAQRLQRLFAHKGCSIVANVPQLLKELDQCLIRRVSVTKKTGAQEENVLALLQKKNETYSLFLVNNNREHRQSVTVSLPFLEGQKNWQVERWDALTGRQEKVRTTDESVFLRFSSELPPNGSALYQIFNHAVSTQALEETLPPKLTFLKSFSPLCTVGRSHPNSLPLDFCSYSWDEKNWSPPMEVWEAQQEFRAKLGMRDISRNGQIQRYRWSEIPHPKNGTRVYLRFSWESEQPFSGLSLALEESSAFSVNLNGEPLENTVTGWFLDKEIRTISLPPCRLGTNQLILSCEYQNSMELEVAYLLGEFSVDSSRKLIPTADSIRVGDWTLQGFPFYAGSMEYRFPLEHLPTTGNIYLKTPRFSGITMTATIGEQQWKLPWEQNAPTDITQAISDYHGSELIIRVYGSPRNLLGPFHLAEGEPTITNDASFTPTGELKTKGYQLVPYGLLETPKLYQK